MFFSQHLFTAPAEQRLTFRVFFVIFTADCLRRAVPVKIQCEAYKCWWSPHTVCAVCVNKHIGVVLKACYPENPNASSVWKTWEVFVFFQGIFFFFFDWLTLRDSCTRVHTRQAPWVPVEILVNIMQIHGLCTHVKHSCLSGTPPSEHNHRFATYSFKIIRWHRFP